MLADLWLDRWLPEIGVRTRGRPVLEIGCGNGDDTRTLLDAGFDVVAFDLSAAAVQRARLRAPAAHIEQRDVRDPFPSDATGLGVVVASLSLHYFAWDETLALFERIRALLRRNETSRAEGQANAGAASAQIDHFIHSANAYAGTIEGATTYQPGSIL